jgi:hypothetical protein
MISMLLHLLRLFPFLCSGHRHLALENLALRQQLALYKRRANRLKLRTSDRLFWVCLSRVWAGWRQALVIVTPDTVLRWQRRRFRLHWTKLSGRPGRTGPAGRFGSPGWARTSDILINSSRRGASFSMISRTSVCRTLQIAARDATQAQPECGRDGGCRGALGLDGHLA